MHAAQNCCTKCRKSKGLRLKKFQMNNSWSCWGKSKKPVSWCEVKMKNFLHFNVAEPRTRILNFKIFTSTIPFFFNSFPFIRSFSVRSIFRPFSISCVSVKSHYSRSKREKKINCSDLYSQKKWNYNSFAYSHEFNWSTTIWQFNWIKVAKMIWKLNLSLEKAYIAWRCLNIHGQIELIIRLIRTTHKSGLVCAHYQQVN